MFLNNVIFHFYVGGGEGVSDSHVQEQILPIGARKGMSSSADIDFFKCQTTGVGGQVVQGVD